MATIADDDDRLLVRIGYTPVSAEVSLSIQWLMWVLGTAETFLTMVDRLVCYIDPGCTWLSSSDFWYPDELWRSSNMCLGMVHW